MEDPDVDDRLMLRYIYIYICMKVGNEGVDWLQLAWDVIQWRSVVYVVKNLWRIVE